MYIKRSINKLELVVLLSAALLPHSGIAADVSNGSSSCTGVSQKTCDSLSDTNKLFDWASKEYPDLFQNHGETFSIDGYLARQYSGKQLYLGSKDREIYGYGSLWGGLIHFGRLEKLLAAVPNKPSAVLTGVLNDTGITFGGNYPSGSNTDCTGTTIQQQDCSHGRDATHNDNSDGHAGFSFTKLDNAGKALAASAANWSCVKDNVTGLIWEVKTDDGGLRDKDWRYTWYNSTGVNDGGSAGTANGGICLGSTHCDTEKFVQQVNSQGLCGKNDWRMPTVKELRNIVNFNRTAPAIDTGYFPHTTHFSDFWSASPGAHGSYYAWHVHFYYGYSDYYVKGASRYVRLVRTGQ